VDIGIDILQAPKPALLYHFFVGRDVDIKVAYSQHDQCKEGYNDNHLVFTYRGEFEHKFRLLKTFVEPELKPEDVGRIYKTYSVKKYQQLF
jgi:hypothetical protein